MEEGAHQLERWHDLYVMLGTSSATLLGLLYVVTSLHLDEIVNNPIFRTRARSNSIYLLITLAEAVAVLTPQPFISLGVEVFALNLIGLWISGRNAFRFLQQRELSQRGGVRLYRAASFMCAFVLGLLAGGVLVRQSTSGFYLITASYFILLVAVALNGWSIMLGVGERGIGGNTHRQ
jgi:hypothetical protein